MYFGGLLVYQDPLLAIRGSMFHKCEQLVPREKLFSENNTFWPNAFLASPTLAGIELALSVH